MNIEQLKIGKSYQMGGEAFATGLKAGFIGIYRGKGRVETANGSTQLVSQPAITMGAQWVKPITD